MYIQAQLSCELQQYLEYYTKYVLKNNNPKINRGYIIKKALEQIEEFAVNKNIDIIQLDWEEIFNDDIEEIIKIIDTNNIKKMNSTINLKADVNEKLEELQREFLKIFEIKRYYKSSVIRLILKAAILLNENKTLPIIINY